MTLSNLHRGLVCCALVTFSTCQAQAVDPQEIPLPLEVGTFNSAVVLDYQLTDASTSDNDHASVPAVPDSSESATGTSVQLSLDELLDAETQSDDAVDTTASQPMEPGWWTPMVLSSLRRGATPSSMTLDQILVSTLQHSKQIQVFAELPVIRETSIIEADAAFDWSAFVDSRWDDNSDPVGNALTAGPGITRFDDHNLGFTAGSRRRTRHGGNLELSQRFGIQENNSSFFVPNNQGTSRLVLSYTQPLMRGKGRVYNEALICLAGIDRRIADDEFLRQLQSHLLEVTRSYWALYLERGSFLQKLKSYARAKSIVARLKRRESIDATQTQIRSAQAALKTRRAELARARAAIENAESRLRSLVNDPQLGSVDATEIIPADHPDFHTFDVDMQACLSEAIQFRPEVSQALRQIQAASVRCQMSKHELQPVLNLITESYVAGLAARRQVGAAWGNQFDQGRPGYSIGLEFEVPLHNRAAKARHTRRRHELRQMQNQYATTLETIRVEVEAAVREVGTSQQELFSKEQAMLARQDQLEYLTERWALLPGEDYSASLMLENLLQAQDQLSAAETDYLQSQMTWNLSLTNLQRANGTLLQHENIAIAKWCECGLRTQSAIKQ